MKKNKHSAVSNLNGWGCHAGGGVYKKGGTQSKHRANTESQHRVQKEEAQVEEEHMALCSVKFERFGVLFWGVVVQ